MKKIKIDLFVPTKSLSSFPEKTTFSACFISSSFNYDISKPFYNFYVKKVSISDESNILMQSFSALPDTANKLPESENLNFFIKLSKFIFNDISYLMHQTYTYQW